jgi:hypothetical protein
MLQRKESARVASLHSPDALHDRSEVSHRATIRLVRACSRAITGEVVRGRLRLHGVHRGLHRLGQRGNFHNGLFSQSRDLSQEAHYYGRQMASGQAAKTKSSKQQASYG